MLIQERDKEKEFLLKDIQDKAQVITSLSDKVSTLETCISNTQSELRVLKMKTHHYLSYISGTSKEFNISNEIKKFKSKLDKNFIEMSYKCFNNPKFPDLVSALRTQPMMFGNMVIEINCLSYLSSSPQTQLKTSVGAFDDAL